MWTSLTLFDSAKVGELYQGRMALLAANDGGVPEHALRVPSLFHLLDCIAALGNLLAQLRLSN